MFLCLLSYPDVTQNRTKLTNWRISYEDLHAIVHASRV
jgi:hypothetical protein